MSSCFLTDAVWSRPPSRLGAGFRARWSRLGQAEAALLQAGFSKATSGTEAGWETHLAKLGTSPCGHALVRERPCLLTLTLCDRPCCFSPPTCSATGSLAPSLSCGPLSQGFVSNFLNNCQCGKHQSPQLKFPHNPDPSLPFPDLSLEAPCWNPLGDGKQLKNLAGRRGPQP